MDSLGLDNPQGVNDAAAGVPYLWSQESLECLLSATNSTEEDESISVFFSDCKNLWNLSSDYAISSGESENNASFCRQKEVQRRASERDEAISAHLGSSNSRPNSKRISEGQEPKTVMTSNYFDLLQSDSSTTEGRLQPITDNQPKPKKPRIEKHQNSSTIDFGQSNNTGSSLGTPDAEAIAHKKEMMYRAAVLRPVNFGPEVVEKLKPKRKNVRLSSDPQTVAARQRRERISERIKMLQRLVPGGTKMDTASMLDEAANYLKFLKLQISALEAVGHKVDAKHCTSFSVPFSLPFYQPISMQTFFPYP